MACKGENIYYLALGAVLSHPSCVRLCDPVDCSPSGSSVHGVSQARIPEWVAISSSRGSPRPKNGTCICLLHGQQVLHCCCQLGSPSGPLIEHKTFLEIILDSTSEITFEELPIIKFLVYCQRKISLVI